MRNLEVQRPYSLTMRTRTKMELHVLCDASEQAFACVAYLRITGNERTSLAFVMGKSRVAPLKPMSIPRLELQAAVMGARMAKCITDGHNVNIHAIHFWTDSRTVLCWIRSDARRYKQFVAHRVGEILETTEVCDWHWIPTALNVADDATRDVKPIELTSTTRWIQGPDFLLLPQAEWPKEPNTLTTVTLDEEVKRDFVALHSTGERNILPDVSRFSSWLRLIRATVRVFKFIRLCGKNRQDTSRFISTEDMREAETYWIRCAQWENFAIESNVLRKGGIVSAESKLFRLSPYMDAEGLMRVNGRVENAKLSNDATHPLILHPKHDYTKLLIKHYHEQAFHCGQETVLNQLRQKYWILDGRAAVRAAWNRCNKCKVLRAKPVQQQMGLLPECRLGISERPFTYTGVDYFGPMMVTVKRKKEKRYGVIFTCLTTRAVHLELSSNLTTDTCMMAIRRFMSRRGQPKEMYSDNGTNFRGASAELSTAFRNLNKNELCDKLAMKQIVWKFAPPSTPHFGGCWERLIRSVKTSLRAILREQAPKEETLLTLMIEVEAIINSRPLTHVTLDHEDSAALTPNCFLLGSTGIENVVIMNRNLSAGGNLRKQWNIAQKLADQFWTRWVKEYAPTLTKRTKWFKPMRSLAVEDLVVLVDETLPRGCWLRGRVSAIYPGKDGQVRVVDVHTVLGTYRRPVNKLAVLNLYEGEENCGPNQKRRQ